VPYIDLQDMFYQNDFNWKVTPSNQNTKEFAEIRQRIETSIDNNKFVFKFATQCDDLQQFIEANFLIGKTNVSKIQIDKNNFLTVFCKWAVEVQPAICVEWEKAKTKNIISADFYLADLLSSDNETLRDTLYVLLRKDRYEYAKTIDDGMFQMKYAEFKDKGAAHKQFWNKYERPPKEIYWDYIVKRRDLLVPQDMRERKGSFFTPQIWVELSQKYIADVFGENWQDKYYVWNCAAGTGNLLNGLVNKRNIWASTLDQADVDIMKTRIGNGANLLEEHVFQCDFLNDDFIPKSKGGKIPDTLYSIISNPEKRKQLIVYINPPYAETNARQETKKGGVGTKIGINKTKTYKKYKDMLGLAQRELFTQFLIRIYKEIADCKIAEFSKLKTLNAPFFATFRNNFKAKLEKCFIVPSYTFDNVTGKFPIGFKIWDTAKSKKFVQIRTDVYNEKGIFISHKVFCSYEKDKFLSHWDLNEEASGNKLGFCHFVGSDFQNQNYCYIVNNKTQLQNQNGIAITENNLLRFSVFFAVRKCIKATWLNDRDQFLYPNDGYKKDTEFQNDCLAYTLFNNKIQSIYGVNHWIPFTEEELNARDNFESTFMSDFIKNKTFSPAAQALFNAGQRLWQYYHKQKNVSINASLYDIREYFQGRNDGGKMNNKSDDETYTALITDLRNKTNTLAQKIEPKVYEYGFLSM
jgi:hypothetical protein